MRKEILLIIFLLLLAFSGLSVSSVVADEAVPAVVSAGLDRPYDPIIIEGAGLADFIKFAGQPLIERLRVMAWRNGAWEVIPFQVDEKKPFKKKGVGPNDLIYMDSVSYFLNSGRRNYKASNTLSENNELVFMARDAGERAPIDKRPAGTTAAIEIELASKGSPEKKSWVYAFFFDSPPPLSKKSYIKYNSDRDEIQTDSYTVGYTKRDASYFSTLSVPPTNGGNGRNMVDSEKMRIRVRLAGGFFDYVLDNFDSFGKCVGAKAGPIRVIRRTRTKLEFFMFMGMSHYHNSYYYPYHFERPVDMSHHNRLPENAFDVTFRLTTDLNPERFPLHISSDKNPEGITPGGAITEQAKDLYYGAASWVAVDGQAGRWVQRLIMPAQAGDKIWTDFFYIDDVKRRDPPEKIPGMFGNVGLMVKHLQLIAKGKQYALAAYYFPPKINEQNINQITNMNSNPVQARISDRIINQESPQGINPTDTRVAENAPEASYVMKESELPKRGYFPQIMIDPNLGNGLGLGYVDRDLFHTGVDIDSFFIFSDRGFFVGHVILNDWSFLPKSKDLKLWIEYQDHPNRFYYGIGNETPERDLTIYHWKQFLAYLSYSQTFKEQFGFRASAGFKDTQIGPGKWFSGKSKPTMQSKFGFDNQIKDARLGPTPFGIEGGNSNYVQLALFNDRRDDSFDPHKGTYEELRVDVVNPALGADFSFVRIGLEGRVFWSPEFLNNSTWYPNNATLAKLFGARKDRIIAARLAFDHIEGPRVDFEGNRVIDVPFFEQSYIGDSYINRGYYWARYVDRDRAYLNVEYRAVVWKMWIIVLFYDTGLVFNDITDEKEWRKVNPDKLHNAFGIGLRGIFPAKLMMRMDLGFSPEHPNGILYGNAYHTF